MVKSWKVRVLIVDEHPLFSLGLSSLLKSVPGYTVIGEAASVESAIKLAEKEYPQLVTLEFHLGDENGLDLIPKLKSLNPEIVILVLSMHDERFYSERILRLGARGYIMKNAPVNDIKEAIKTVMDGKVYLSENEKNRIFEAMTGESSRSLKALGENAQSENNSCVNSRGENERESLMQKLSDRELHIFSLLGKGYSIMEIASKINLNARTVDSHKEHIKKKLRCGTSLELRQFAIEWINHTSVL